MTTAADFVHVHPCVMQPINLAAGATHEQRNNFQTLSTCTCVQPGSLLAKQQAGLKPFILLLLTVQVQPARWRLTRMATVWQSRKAMMSTSLAPRAAWWLPEVPKPLL